jgi:UDP:flavonoid glycosyltransferase YjiC (YdhE family)
MLPLFAGDQWRTAHRVDELGAGIAVHGGERRVFDPPPDELIATLPAAVRGVLDDARYRETAARLGAQMAALPAADAAAAALATRF